MNILLAFKLEPDASMLAEQEWQAATLGTRGPDTSLLRSSPGVDEQAAAALLLRQRGDAEFTATALTVGDERAIYWLRYFAALGFDRRVLLESSADLRFAATAVAQEIVAWQRQYGEALILTGCQSSEGQNGQTPFLIAEMLGWPCLTQVEQFTLEPPYIVVEQRTSGGRRRCRVRLPVVLGVRQCGDVALPVPGMRQRLAAAKSVILRQPVVGAMTPGARCRQLTRPVKQRHVTMIAGASAAEKADRLWTEWLSSRMQP